MNIAEAISGVLTERAALQQPEAVFSPTYISEHMQRLAQYNGSLEENLAENEKLLELREATLFKEFREKGMSTNSAQTQLKYEVAADKAEIIRLARLCSSSWRIIATSQSRIKHLLAEAANQI
jgi:hypothetical protein